ncbi:MAG TPA: dipeptidase PepE [Chryseosolibacter sp.]|nr:dipeptidase PepE [Chryseosolibacter sp.]
MVRALLMSNSTMPGTSFFTWPRPFVKSFLGDKVKELVFIPFAAVTLSWDEYESKVKEVFGEMGCKIKSIHHAKDKSKAIEKAGGVVVGGGNTFALLTEMHKDNLIVYVRDKVLHGSPYIGWSAGANLACPTIMTTNDMPVIYPPSFEALDLVPFQINPHYHELKFEGQGGETRRERLEEFIKVNPERRVVGLPEGMLLHRENDKIMLKGEGVARLYERSQPVKDLMPDQDVSFLL